CHDAVEIEVHVRLVDAVEVLLVREGDEIAVAEPVRLIGCELRRRAARDEGCTRDERYNALHDAPPARSGLGSATRDAASRQGTGFNPPAVMDHSDLRYSTRSCCS